MLCNFVQRWKHEVSLHCPGLHYVNAESSAIDMEVRLLCAACRHLITLAAGSSRTEQRVADLRDLLPHGSSRVLPGMQSSSSNGAEGLVDLRRLGDLILPADLNHPNDPKVFVVDPKSPEAWKTQVHLH